MGRSESAVISLCRLRFLVLVALVLAFPASSLALGEGAGGSGSLFYDLGGQAFRDGEYRQAVGWLEEYLWNERILYRARGDFPWTAEQIRAHLLLGRSHLYLGQTSKALEALHPVRLVRPQDQEIQCYLDLLANPPGPARLGEVRLPGLGRSSESLSRYRGKVVLLHFWATWCPPCREELPSLAAFYREHYPELQDRGLVLLTVSNDLREQDLLSYPGELPFPVFFDSLNQVNGHFGVEGIPETIVIGRRGMVVDRMCGGQDWQSPGLRRRLRWYLDQPDTHDDGTTAARRMR